MTPFKQKKKPNMVKHNNTLWNNISNIPSETNEQSLPKGESPHHIRCVMSPMLIKIASSLSSSPLLEKKVNGNGGEVVRRRKVEIALV
jgi:hypothetical protein